MPKLVSLARERDIWKSLVRNFAITLLLECRDNVCTLDACSILARFVTNLHIIARFFLFSPTSGLFFLKGLDV